MPAATRSAFSEDEIRAQIASVGWWHQIEIAPGIVTPGPDHSAEKLKLFQIPADLTGKRVLDIGAFDGFFSFECERRGAAEVVAIDAAPPAGFFIAHELLGSQVKFYKMNIYDLSPEMLGRFDLVLCLGVLYHLRHPLLGLERIHAVCRGQLILETAVCDQHFVDASRSARALADVAPALLLVPIAQFYPGDELNNDHTNWWSPNLAGLHGMLRSSGFIPHQTIPAGARTCVHCLRVDQPEAREWVDTARNNRLRPDDPVAQVLQKSGMIDMQAILAGSPQEDRGAVHPPAGPVQHLAEPHQAAGAPVVPVQGERSAHLDQPLSELLAQALAAQGQQTLYFQQMLVQRDSQVAELEARAGWLEGQAREARRALAAVENGRVMRILRWLSRAK
jgi:tRNA (mo5U34)-methyltransferase